MASAFEVFQRAERIEAVAAAVYASLARRFGDDEEAGSLFSRLEQEELQHASRVRLLASAYQHDSKLVRQVNGAAELEACLAAAEQALAEVQAGGWGPDVREALRRAKELEDRLVAAHANLLAMNADGALRAFFEQLALMDAGHVALLRR